MSDFDFDEIDKAVNNALSGTPETPVTPVSAPAPIAPVTPPAPQPPVAPVQPSVTPPAARRSAGQFMDIAHPSFAVRNQAPAEEPKQTPVVPQSSTPPASFTNDLEAFSAPEPLESPFIADAKVEKRPLGGEAPTVPEFDPSELLEAPDELRIEAHAMPDPIEFAARTEAPVVTEPVVTQVYEEPPVPEPLQAQTPISIAQQYQEKTTDSLETGAIFDTETYHQPLVHTPKKRVGFWTPFWIILLILLGGGAGAALYFFILPTL